MIERIIDYKMCFQENMQKANVIFFIIYNNTE